MKPLLPLVSSLLVLAPAALSQGVPMPALPEKRACAELEPSLGTLVTYPTGLPGSLIKELAADDVLYILVDGPNNMAQAQAALGALGVPLTSVEFVQGPTETIWTRDWGAPQVFLPGGSQIYVDPMFWGYTYDSFDGTSFTWFQGSHTNDDASPAAVADHIGVGHVQLPAHLVGGNIDFDGLGRAFATELLIKENSHHGVQETAYRRILKRYLGVEDLTILPNYGIWGLQHIDCVLKVMDEETIVITRPPASHPSSPHVEALASIVAGMTGPYGRPYDIHRIDTAVFDGTGPSGETANYANTLILNEKILVPTFGIPMVDNAALEAYRDAMPGYEVSGYTLVGGPYPMGAFSSEDSLHCRTHQVFDPEMVLIKHPRVRGASASDPTIPVQALIRAYSGTPLNQASSGVFWRAQGSTAWNQVPLQYAGTPREFVADLPGQSAGTTVEYYISATDGAGRTENKPPLGPEGPYSFTVN